MGLARDRDVWSGLALAALGIFVLREALQWTYVGPDGPGPGFFPVGYGILLVGLSLFQIAKAILRPDPSAREAMDWHGLGRALGTWGAFAAAIAAMQPLGFYASFALLTIVLVAGVMKKPLGVAVVTALAMSASFYVVFSWLLGLDLPAGSLWTPLLRAAGLVH